MPLAIALGVLALAHLFDWASFLVMIGRHGMAAEANPIVVLLEGQIGVFGLTIAKLLVVAFVAGLVMVIGTRRPRVATGLFVFAVAAGLVGGVSNIATL